MQDSPMIVAVVDGMGGGIGAQIVAQLRQELPLEVEIIALGTNSTATQKMMKARANRGASGENAIRVSVNQADVILAPIGVVVPNSMMGEITPAIAESIAMARGLKLLLPISQPHLEMVGVEAKPLARQIAQAIERIKAHLPADKAHLPADKVIPEKVVGGLDISGGMGHHGGGQHDVAPIDGRSSTSDAGS